MDKTKKKIMDVLAYNLYEVIRDEPTIPGSYEIYSKIVDYINSDEFDDSNKIGLSFEIIKELKDVK
jgi:hypothetical protein